MKSKKVNRSGKKSVDSKASEESLTAMLLRKHGRVSQRGEKTAQIALILETVLSGSDEQLQQVLQSWENIESIDSIVKAWGPSNSTLLFTRLLSFLGTASHNWTFPWLQAILKLNIPLSVESMGQVHGSLANESSAPLEELTRLEGKIEMFDV